MLYKRRIYFILTIIMMTIIFLFSSQPSKDSNFLSYSITNKIYKRIECNTNKSETLKKDVVITNTTESVFPETNEKFIKINYIIRKSAHIFLYLMLGMFFLLYINTYEISLNKAIIITSIFCFMYSCLDEFNQYLRGTRTALFTDCLIDTFGCMLGCLFIGIFYKVFLNKLDNKRKL